MTMPHIDGADTFQQKKFRTAADYAFEHKNYEIAFLLDTQSTRRRLRFDFRRKCRATAEVMVLDFDNQIDSSGLILNVFKTSDTSLNELMPLEDSESDISHNVKEKELYESNRVKPMTGKALNAQPFRKDMEKLDDSVMYLSFHEANYKGQSAKAHRPTESSRLTSMVNEGEFVYALFLSFVSSTPRLYSEYTNCICAPFRPPNPNPNPNPNPLHCYQHSQVMRSGKCCLDPRCGTINQRISPTSC
jgi:hypothetical protein